MTARLEVRKLNRRFGGLQALSDMSFDTQRGEIFGVIGPNGAGKTTLFNVIAGSLPPSSGEVFFDGVEMTGLSPDKVARRGIARTFQATNVFKRETVEENLRRGMLLGQIYSPTAFVRRRGGHGSVVDALQIREIAEFVGLTDVLYKTAEDLSYGAQKILGVGMALMTRPHLMFMDEPAAGLNPTEKLRMGALIRSVNRARHIDVIVVEHDMQLIMQTCDRIMVMSYGKRIALGPPADIRADEKVIDAYLGADYEFS